MSLAGRTEGLVKTAYPDRETFRFKNAEGNEVMSYACAPGVTEAETKARAGKAHRFFEERLDAIATDFADAMIEGVEMGVTPDFQIVATELEQGADRIALQTEERYQCLFVDSQEL